ncbi:MAG: hypothetical protein HOV80_20580 [Polyangiaceae bacterium]|nr:hypothetical protein [Polyangiaceae bacterium]
MRSSLLLLFALVGCSNEVVRLDDEPPVSPVDDEEPVAPAWTTLSDRGMIGPRDVILAEDGSTAVFGLSLREDVSACAVERFDRFGTPLTTSRYTTSGSGHALTSAVAATKGPGGQIVLLCQAVLDGGATASWVGWVDTHGALVAEIEIPDVAGYDLLYAEDDDEVIVVGADQRYPSIGVAAVYQQVSPSGPTAAPYVQGSSSPESSAAALSVARHPDGWTAVVKVDSDPTGRVTEAKLARLGVPLIVEWIDDPCAALVAVDLDGNIYTAGDAFDDSGPIVCKHTQSEDGVWSVEVLDVELPEAEYVGISGIAIDKNGSLVVSGFSEPSDPLVEAEMFARSYAPNGEMLWRDDYRGEDGRFAFGMALGVADGRVVHAGLVTGSTTYAYRMVVRSFSP